MSKKFEIFLEPANSSTPTRVSITTESVTISFEAAAGATFYIVHVEELVQIKFYNFCKKKTCFNVFLDFMNNNVADELLMDYLKTYFL